MTAFNNLPNSTIKEEILDLIKTIFKELTGTNVHALAVSQVGPPKIAKEQTLANWCAFVPGRKVCPVTGYNMTHQMSQSKYLSMKTIMELSDDLYNVIFNMYGVNLKASSGKDRIAYLIAHRIRNKGKKG